ncbi:unnamed protein product [Prunus armeniaca]
MRQLSQTSFDWVAALDPSQWCRAHFKTHSKCDILLNNMCEAFNGALVEVRDKSILTMLERIRYYIMLLIATRRASCEKWKDAIGSRIFRILEKTKKESAWCIPKLAGESLYEVKNHDGSQVVVDLAGHCCSCRRWDITGILCKHACAAIVQLNGDHIAYVDACYKKKAFMRAYGPMVHPMTSEDLWPKCDRPPLMPPLYHKQPGRPRKKRMRSAGEQPSKSNPTATKLQRYNLETKCSLCRQGGHNMRSCPKAKEGSSSRKSTQDTTSTKRVTRQSTAKQPVRRRLETGQCSQTPHGSETGQASQTAPAPASQTAPPSVPAQASQTGQASDTPKKKRFKSPAKRIKFPKKKDGSQTLQGSQSVQGTESVQACPVSQTAQSSQPAQTSQSVQGSQPSASLSHPFASGPSKKRFKSPTKRMKFTNRKDLVDGYQPWRF